MKFVTALKKTKAVIDTRILATCIVASTPVLSFAQNTGSIQGFDNAKQQAGSKKLDDVANNVDRFAGNTYNSMTTVATLVGVFLVAISLWNLYKASKEDRESPKHAIVGLIIGGLMTVIGLVTAFSANTTTT